MFSSATTTARMSRRVCALSAAALLSACATVPHSATGGTEEIQILALNDFHGNLATPAGDVTYYGDGQEMKEPLGGAAQIGATLAKLRQGEKQTITVGAGDMIGASPLASAYYLDEPAIMALNRMGLALASVGNHEFDKGVGELRRMQEGGCETFTRRTPCQIDKPFEGAKFNYLAANVIGQDGNSLFPGTSLRRFGKVTVGFIGMTLKETGTLTSPAGTQGYRFTDEADTANVLAEKLVAQGADTVVVLLHQGATVDPFYNEDSCPKMGGDIVPILDRLSPAIRLVVSGHTHKAYICEVPAADGSTRLLTSAGRYGNFVTDIRLTMDPKANSVIAFSAKNVPVSSDVGKQPDIEQIVDRYVAASAEIAARPVGRINGTLDAGEGALDTPLGRLVADAQIAATSSPEEGGAEIAFINSGGVRAGFSTNPDGSVTYGQIFALQPFGNTLEVLELTGAELKDVLEQQFSGEGGKKIGSSILIPSKGFTFSFDASRAEGDRIVDMVLQGQPILPAKTYRITVNNFLASGGDGYSALRKGKFVKGGMPDLDALEAFLAPGVTPDAMARVSDVTPK